MSKRECTEAERRFLDEMTLEKIREACWDSGLEGAAKYLDRIIEERQPKRDPVEVFIAEVHDALAKLDAARKEKP